MSTPTFQEPQVSVVEQPVAPFTMAYVLGITSKHMRKGIDISIRKTFARVPEFAKDPVKSQEIFETLAHLHTLREQLDTYQAIHSDKFKE